MRYLIIEPRDRIYVKGYGFLSSAKNTKNKYSQKFFDSAKKSATDAIKTTSKKGIQKIAEATGDLILNNIADKSTNISKSRKEFRLNELYSKTDDNEIEIPKERYISPEKRQRIIDELRLV